MVLELLFELHIIYFYIPNYNEHLLLVIEIVITFY
jgi:hypothetical protein